MIFRLNRKYVLNGLLAWIAILFLPGCSIHGVELRLRATSAVTSGAGQTLSEAQLQQIVKITEEVARRFRMSAWEPSLILELRRRELSYSRYILLAGYEKPGSGGYSKRGDSARVQLSVRVSKDKSELLISVVDRHSIELTPLVREIQDAIRGKVKEAFPGYTMEWKEG